MNSSLLDPSSSQPMASVRTLDDLRGPAGRLEAILNSGAASAPYATVICHPHPLFAGTMHNKVVYNAMKVMQQLGLPVLRFNFRGAGLSEGAHDHGQGEQDDVRAAIDWMDREYGLPLLVTGFSFGSHMALRATCSDSRVRGLIALGLPIQAGDRDYTYEFLHDCTQPKLFVSGARDAFGPIDAVERAVALATPPAKLVWVPEADHFFTGKLDAMQAAMRTWLEAHFFTAPATSQLAERDPA